MPLTARANQPLEGYSDTARSISMTCGGTKVTIECGYNKNISETDNRFCNENKLTFYPEGGHLISIPIPKSHDPNSTPISIECGTGKNDRMYIGINYLMGSYYTCGNCIVFEIYSPDGLILSDKIISSKLEIEHSINKWSGLAIESHSP
jgi:hypothetical protein